MQTATPVILPAAVSAAVSRAIAEHADRDRWAAYEHAKRLIARACRQVDAGAYDRALRAYRDATGT